MNGFLHSNHYFFLHGREKVVIPKDKPYIFLRGNGRGKTAIVYSDGSAENSESAIFTVSADNVIVFGLSIKVSYSFTNNTNPTNTPHNTTKPPPPPPSKFG